MEIIKYPNGVECQIDSDGSKFWYQDGKLHRDNDLPAVEWADGSRSWYKDGKHHRDNGLPAIIRSDGECYWLVDGKPVPPPAWYKVLTE